MSKRIVREHGRYSYTNHRTLEGAFKQARRLGGEHKIMINARFRETGSRYSKGDYEWRTIHGLSRGDVYDEYFDGGAFDGYELDDVGGSDLTSQHITGYTVMWL